MLSLIFLYISFALSFSFILLTPNSNPDIFWHLSAARHILSTGAFPRTDFLSFTQAGQPWIDFEWLAQLIYLAAHALAGLQGFAVLKAILFSLLLLVLNQTLKLYTQNLLARGGYLVVVAAALAPSMIPRPDNFSLLLFTIQIHFLEQARLRQWTIFKKGCSAWHCPLAFMLLYSLWANLHAGFVMGLFLLGLYAIGTLNSNGKSESFSIFKLLFAGCAGSLLNPYGPGIYKVLWEHWTYLEKLQEQIVEWAPSTVLNLWQAPFWLLLLFSFMIQMAFFLQTKRIILSHLASILLLGLASASHYRNSSFFILAAVPFSLCALTQMRFPHRLVRQAWIFPVGTLFGAAWFAWEFVKPVSAYFRDKAPPLALEGFSRFHKTHSEEFKGRRIYNPWEWGGYLGYKLYPDLRVFVDGRYIFHPLLEEIQEARQDPIRWQGLLDRYGMDLCLMQRDPNNVLVHTRMPDNSLVPWWRPSFTVWMPEPKWALIYWDRHSLVFARRTAFKETWLRDKEFVHLRPEDFVWTATQFLTGHIPAGQVEKEILRYLQISNDGEEGKRILDWWKRVKPPEFRVKSSVKTVD